MIDKEISSKLAITTVRRDVDLKTHQNHARLAII